MTTKKIEKLFGGLRYPYKPGDHMPNYKWFNDVTDKINELIAHANETAGEALAPEQVSGTITNSKTGDSYPIPFIGGLFNRVQTEAPEPEYTVSIRQTNGLSQVECGDGKRHYIPTEAPEPEKLRSFTMTDCDPFKPENAPKTYVHAAFPTEVDILKKENAKLESEIVRMKSTALHYRDESLDQQLENASLKARMREAKKLVTKHTEETDCITYILNKAIDLLSDDGETK